MHVDGGDRQKPIYCQRRHFQNSRLVAILDILVSKLTLGRQAAILDFLVSGL